MADALDPRPNFSRKVPDGDELERLVCDTCGHIQYENSKIVVGSVLSWSEGAEERILLCRRAIEPRSGYWTIPAGYMELGETSAEGAAREAWEEAFAKAEIGPLFAVYNIPRIGQVHLFYLGTLTSPDVAAGIESLEVALYGWDEIPWDDLAFPSAGWALRHARELRGQENFTIRTNPPGETGGLTQA